MEKSLQEVLHENKERAYKKRVAELKKKRKQQERKECIIFCFVVAFIVVLTVVSIIATSGDLERCKANHSENYCLARM